MKTYSHLMCQPSYQLMPLLPHKAGCFGWVWKVYRKCQKRKFQIPFRRMAVVRLKYGGGDGAPLVKYSHSVQPHCHIIKIVYSIKHSNFLFIGSCGGAFGIKHWSWPILSCFAKKLVNLTAPMANSTLQTCVWYQSDQPVHTCGFMSLHCVWHYIWSYKWSVHYGNSDLYIMCMSSLPYHMCVFQPSLRNRTLEASMHQLRKELKEHKETAK